MRRLIIFLSVLPSRQNWNFAAFVLLGAWLVAFPQIANAEGPLTAAAGNSRWNYAASSHTATFLANDQPGPATLELRKASIFGGSVSIQSDADAIHLASGKGMELIIAVAAKPDGATTAMKFEGGDDPHIVINDVQSARLQGKWIQLVRDQSGAISINLEAATFATIHIVPGPGGDAATDAASSITGATAAPKELLHDVSARQLIASEKLFCGSVMKSCTHCGGTGKVTAQVQTGEHKEGAFIVPDYRDETNACPVCNGKGAVRSSDEVLKRLCGSFLKNLAHLDQTDPAAQDAISQSYDMIAGSMIGDFKTWTMLNQNGRSVFSRSNPTAGTPVVAQVEILSCNSDQGGRKDFTVRLTGTDQQAHVVDPVSADRLTSGVALMGGLVESDGDKKTPIIANGFLVAPPIDKNWYWWWLAK